MYQINENYFNIKNSKDLDSIIIINDESDLLVNLNNKIDKSSDIVIDKLDQTFNIIIDKIDQTSNIVIDKINNKLDQNDVVLKKLNIKIKDINQKIDNLYDIALNNELKLDNLYDIALNNEIKLDKLINYFINDNKEQKDEIEKLKQIIEEKSKNTNFNQQNDFTPRIGSLQKTPFPFGSILSYKYEN